MRSDKFKGFDVFQRIQEPLRMRMTYGKLQVDLWDFIQLTKSSHHTSRSLDFIQLTNVLLTKKKTWKKVWVEFLIFFKAIIHSLQRALIE
jgi:hypothetical protein